MLPVLFNSERSKEVLFPHDLYLKTVSCQRTLPSVQQQMEVPTTGRGGDRAPSGMQGTSGCSVADR